MCVIAASTRSCAVWNVFWLLLCGQINFNNACSEHAVQTAIFDGYKKAIRPVRLQSTVTNISVHTEIYSILSINAQEESIKLITWTSMTWTDEFLKWNLSQFDNCTYINTLASSVWQPDYMFVNILEITPIVPSDLQYVYISHEGTLTLWLDHHVTIRCALDITAFPFDNQTCTIISSVWTYDTALVIMSLADIPNLDMVHLGSSEFETTSFEGISNSYLDPKTNVTYSQLEYSLGLKRRPEYYIFVLILPTFLLTTLCIIGIFMPNSSIGERNEKMTLGLTTLLSMAVILNITADQMPKSSKGLTLLGYYVIYEIAVCFISTILSTGIIFVHEKAYAQDWDPPRIIQWIANIKTPCEYIRRITEKTDNSVTGQWVLTSEFEQLSGKNIYRNMNTNVEVQGSGRASLLNNAIDDKELFSLLKRIINTVENHLKELKRDKEKNRVWIKALDRIDLLFLVTLLLSNFVLTAVILL